MLFFYWILVVIYILLLFLYTFTSPYGQKIEPWPILPLEIPNYEWTPPKISLACKKNEECPTDYICLNKQCLPKYVTGGTCDHPYGIWQSYNYKGAQFALCVCLSPEIFTQKHFGSNCDVSVACGAHGRHNLVNNSCDCDVGFTPGPKLTCIRLPASQLEKCESDEISVKNISQSDGFHTDYVTKLLSTNTKCIKRPCTFDPWSGKSLKKGRYENGFGCICDPRYGLIGVLMKNIKYTQDEKGDNACISIYKEPLTHPRNDIEMFQYFYLKERAPVTLLRFRNLNSNDIIQMFRNRIKNSTLILSAEWPRNFMQYILSKMNGSYDSRIRYCYNVFLGNPTCIENALEKNYIAPICKDLETITVDKMVPHAKITLYKQMYRYPVCEIKKDDQSVDIALRGTMVLNPYHLTYDHDYFRSNGLILIYRGDVKKWYLDTAPPYHIDRYKTIYDETNCPIIPVKIPQVKPGYGRVI